MNSNEELPENICIRLNRQCNLTCSFCLANTKTPELSTEQILQALEYFKANGIKKARLAGGEPTLRSDLIEIVKFCISLDLKTTIYSNLVDIDHIFDQLIQYPISLTTSIHGNQMFHDSITQQGAYESTYKNINKLISNNIDVSMHTVLMKENYIYAEELIENAIKMGIKKISFQTLIPRGKGIEFFKDKEDTEDIIERLNALYPLQEKYQNDIKIKFINLYEKYYYVLETDGCLYLQKQNEANDIFIRRII